MCACDSSSIVIVPPSTSASPMQTLLSFGLLHFVIKKTLPHSRCTHKWLHIVWPKQIGGFCHIHKGIRDRHREGQYQITGNSPCQLPAHTISHPLEEYRNKAHILMNRAATHEHRRTRAAQGQAKRNCNRRQSTSSKGEWPCFRQPHSRVFTHSLHQTHTKQGQQQVRVQGVVAAKRSQRKWSA